MSSPVNIGYQGRILKGAALAAANTPPQPAPSPAEQAVDEAQRRSDAILYEARQQAERTIIDGQEQARLLSENAQHEADQQLARRLQHLSRAFRNEIEEVQPRLVSIVVDAVSDIIGLVPDEELVERLLTTALKDIDRRAAVTIFSSPQNYLAAADLVRRMRHEGETQVEFVEIDQHLQDGIFRIEANGVSTLVSVDAQLNVLERILSGAEPDPSATPSYE